MCRQAHLLFFVLLYFPAVVESMGGWGLFEGGGNAKWGKREVGNGRSWGIF